MHWLEDQHIEGTWKWKTTSTLLPSSTEKQRDWFLTLCPVELSLQLNHSTHQRTRHITSHVLRLFRMMAHIPSQLYDFLFGDLLLLKSKMSSQRLFSDVGYFKCPLSDCHSPLSFLMFSSEWISIPLSSFCLVFWYPNHSLNFQFHLLYTRNIILEDTSLKPEFQQKLGGKCSAHIVRTSNYNLKRVWEFWCHYSVILYFQSINNMYLWWWLYGQATQDGFSLYISCLTGACFTYTQLIRLIFLHIHPRPQLMTVLDLNQNSPLCLSKGWWEAWPCADYPHNQWANLTSTPLWLVTSSSPPGAKTAIMSYPPAPTHGRMLLQDFASDV